ncbi:transporter substrate-binding domain-containing protein [Salidesulfovibrio onnuriiensis]|uniref:transporter substrate-binding domain-containing protein n=1 Tax=Salidesulfovibrio onnuriiensis TaxID=2583823 RepID=UPI0011CC5ED9|nr:transporter substrate-binding domain-containing protein [Salidesulfovibrio onnuriiensis]
MSTACRIAAILTLSLCFGLFGAVFGRAESVRIVYDQWPPYEYTDSRQRPAGISYEVTRAVLKAMGIEISSAKGVPWSRGLQMLELGQADILLSGIRCPKREKFALFPSESMLTAQWRVFVPCFRSREHQYTSLESLRGKRVGVVQDYAYSPTLLKRLGEIAETQTVLTDEANFRKLMENRIDAALCDHRNGLWLSHQLGLECDVCPAPFLLEEQRIYTLFSKETVNKSFIGRFSEELRIFKTTPEYGRILEQTAPKSE